VAKRVQVRLGVLGAATGDRLVAPGPNLTGQALFLRAVERTVPAAFRELAKIAAPPDAPGLRASARVNARLAGLRAWGDRFGFTDPWLRRVAASTFRLLAESDPTHRPTRFIWLSNGIEDIGSRFPPAPRWNPILQSRTEYHAAIDAYLDACASMATARGWRPAPVKRTAEHFEWLARHQVAGWTEARIAEHYQTEAGKPDVPGVSRALTETAALVGITLRAAPGRALSHKRRR